MKKILVAIALALLLSGIGLTVNSAIANAYTDVQCKSASDTHQWGVWPAAQFLTDHTYWCWGKKWTSPTTYEKVITYRTDSITGGGNEVGGFCELQSSTHWMLGDYPYYKKWEEQGNFKCITNIPGIFIYPKDKMIIWVDASGHYCGPDNCPCAAKGTCNP